MAESFIWITTSFIGFHKWKDAPTDCEYLKSIHRHKFNVKIWLQVKNNDRDVEFQTFKLRVDELLKHPFLQNKEASCELYCDAIHNLIYEGLAIDDRKIRISVDEDGENGAYKEYD